MVRHAGDRPPAGAVLTALPELEAVEAAAWREQYAGLDPELRALTVDVGALQVFGVGAWPDSAWHNVLTGRPEPKTLDLALALLGRLGATAPVVQLAEGAHPAAEELLAARGFAPTTRLVRLHAPAVPGELPAGVEVAGTDQGSTVASVCLKGFGQVDQRWWRGGLGREGWTQVVARTGEVAVGTGALFVRGDDAWIGSATTVPEARGRGVHAAVLQARLGLAAAQGATRVSVKCLPGSASYRSLVRAGFAVSHPVAQWRRRPA